MLLEFVERDTDAVNLADAMITEHTVNSKQQGSPS